MLVTTLQITVKKGYKSVLNVGGWLVCCALCYKYSDRLFYAISCLYKYNEYIRFVNK